jgi:ATPase family associated with various cellular activities (AAA)
MSDTCEWLDSNEQYLAASLALLRLRLTKHAQSLDQVPGDGHARNRPVSDEEIDCAREAVEAAESAVPPPAAIILSRRLGMSSFERDILILCAAMELDTRIAGLCACAHDNSHRPFPTFALALAALPDPRWDALSPDRPLRYWRLLEIAQPAAQPLTTSPLRADERIVNYLKGLNHLDERVAPLLMPLTASGGDALPSSQLAIAETIASGLQAVADTKSLPVVQLVGPDSASKQLVAARAAADLGLRLCRLPADVLSPQTSDLEVLSRLWQRESMMLPLALYIDAHDVDRPGEGAGSPINRFIARTNGIVFLDTRESWTRLDRDCLVFDISTPTPSEQKNLWREELDGCSDEDAARLADQFNLGVGSIDRICRLTRATAGSAGDAASDRVWQACLTETRPRLDKLVQRIDARATWDDIVLPENELKLLEQIAGQVRQRGRVYNDWGFRRRMNRGLGISALFAGESGTGKTMAAEVLANDLRLDLYRIDLSAVISKYIGETEKNLRRVFDAAENGGAILLFDEADALFGKRSEVKDSHDRYANIEVNYLLQRMEAYRGLAVLATNMKSALDMAFMRRLRFVLHFPFPGVTERRVMWQRAFPSETPVEAFDVERLARLNLAGGSIHNIALNAAFVAAHRGSPITTAIVLESARAEFRKLEKPIDESDFRLLESMAGARAAGAR